jgi:hypothetical protein
MSLAALAIEKRAVTYFFVVLMTLGGLQSFFQLGWLEDPEYTVKTAAITTAYPGASAEEVELEVTDLIETKLQEMVELKDIYSYSHPGLSVGRRSSRPVPANRISVTTSASCSASCSPSPATGSATPSWRSTPRNSARR